MADIPRDPRQLARDILAGKVRIEDLARERQMRAGGLPTPALRQPQARVPAPRPAPMQPPVQRAPVRPVQRPIPMRPLQQPQRLVQRPVAAPVVRQPQRPLQVTIAPPPPVQPAIAPTPEPATVTKAARLPTRIRDMVRSKQALRQGIVLAEVLGKPVALRDEM